MLKLTKEETVFVKQLFGVRLTMKQLEIEDTTHTDRLLTILRGHQVNQAQAGEYTIDRVVFDGRESIMIRHLGRLPHEV